MLRHTDRQTRQIMPVCWHFLTDSQNIWQIFDGGMPVYRHLISDRQEMTCQLTNNFCWQTGNTTFFIWACVIRLYDTLLNTTCHRTCFLIKTISTKWTFFMYFSIASPHTLLPFCFVLAPRERAYRLWLRPGTIQIYLNPILSAPRGRHSPLPLEPCPLP